MQEAAFFAAAGQAGAPGATADLRRGDLVFWKGHVAIARDRDR